jgi:hypothetical protein
LGITRKWEQEWDLQAPDIVASAPPQTEGGLQAAHYNRLARNLPAAHGTSVRIRDG